MAKKINWYKIGIFAAIIAAMFLLGRSCGIKSVLKNEGVDTTVRKDSVVIAYIPIPIAIRYDSISYKHTTEYVTLYGAPEIIIEPVDTANILKDYYASRFYSDTQRLKRGLAIITDTVNRNRITGRRLTITGTDTTITRTIVLKPPRRIVGYLTGSIMGNFKNPISGAGIGFGVKMPNDMTYQMEYKVVNGYRPMIEGRVMFPIRLFRLTQRPPGR